MTTPWRGGYEKAFNHKLKSQTTLFYTHPSLKIPLIFSTVSKYRRASKARVGLPLIAIDNNNIIRGVTNLSKGEPKHLQLFMCSGDRNEQLVHSSAQHLLQLPSDPVPEFD